MCEDLTLATLAAGYKPSKFTDILYEYRLQSQFCTKFSKTLGGGLFPQENYEI